MGQPYTTTLSSTPSSSCSVACTPWPKYTVESTKGVSQSLPGR